MDELTGLPLAFGKPVQEKKQFGNLSRVEQTKRGQGTTSKPQDKGKQVAIEDDQHDEQPREEQPEDEEDGDDVGPTGSSSGDLPTTHEVVLKDHIKTVSALSMDPSGARLVSGSYDYDLKIWDFGGMKSDFKPFRSFESRAGHQVVDVAFSNSGDSFLAANGSDQVKYYDRDGAELGEFVKGDMYIRDLRNTSGHVSSVSSLSWHPTNPSLFLTASSDSTLRIWDKTNRRQSKSVIVVKSKERGGKTKVTSCCWSKPDGKLIAAANEDGSLMVWKASGNFTRPDYSNDKAHEKGTITSSVVFSKDGKYLATRGGDGTVKLWNPKSLKKPLSVLTSLPSLNSETSLTFSPDGQYLLTGTAGSKAGVLPGNQQESKAAELEKELGQRMGEIVVIKVDTEKGEMEIRERIEISEFSVVKVIWHERINQIVCSTSSGEIHVLYSPELSTKGALLGLTRTVRKPTVESTFNSNADGTELDRPIIAPHSLPMFKDDLNGERGVSAGGRGGKRKRERERHDPQKTLKPTPPITGPGRGGRVGASATQHVVQGMIKSNLRDQDPREALLKYATNDPGENTWTSAWSKSQPKPVFDDRSDSDDDVVKERPK
ncbi:WD40 repeat domain-containing protein [Sporobolomyces salmoneus]|uniref:WD40 repeat domain-containing protein n=1 Tax=Sporobolomyces salmoneus TaxID=183962 RepID=UPI003172EF03